MHIFLVIPNESFILQLSIFADQKRCIKMKAWVNNSSGDEELSSQHKFDGLKNQQSKSE